LHVLLAALLLDFYASPRMSILQYDSGPTSNDLLRDLIEKRRSVALNYQIIAQSADDVQSIQNAPAVNMAPYLLESGQLRLLTIISIYSLRGEDREQIRLFYMNATALRVWREMGRTPKIIGSLARPPHTALLTFGVPFSE
jgi:hypothetical protein